MNKIFKQIIEELSKEMNFNYKFLSKDWIIMIEKDNKVRFFSGYKFDLNNQALGNVLDDKYALYDVLKYKNLPVIEYKIVYGEDNNNDYAEGCKGVEYVRKFFEANNNHIVIKPNNGTCGASVYQIQNEEELEDIYNELISKHYSINVSPFYKIKNEFRTVIVNNEIKIIYQKNLPVVYGDGKHTIRELLFDFNESFFKTRLAEDKYDRVLELNEKFEYGWKFNLSQGAKATLIEDANLKEKIGNMALMIASTINMKYGSVDIILTEYGKLFVLEINSGIMLDNYINQFDGYNVAKDIYKSAIELSFKN